MALTPRMATWGGLSTGVNDSTPRLPRLEMVNVPPLRSSTPMEPATAWAASSFMRRARPTRDRSWLSRTTGTTRPRSVSQAKPMWTAAWR